MTADTLHQVFSIYETLRACSKSGILALQTPKFYLAGSKRARKSGFLRSIDRKNPQFEQALKDSIKVTRRSIKQSIDSLHNNTIFFGEQQDKVIDKILFVESELDDIMILSLFASFERDLRISIQNIIGGNMNKTNHVIVKFIELMTESVERWTIKEIIDAFEGVVDEKIRSIVKQIYDYRNWVAHGKNPNRPLPIRTDPKIVFINLCDFVTQASMVL